MHQVESSSFVVPQIRPWRAWLVVTRIPFMSVGILPFILGLIMAVRHGHDFSLEVIAVSVTAVAGILAVTHWLGEYFDLHGDALNKNHNRFSGGSRILVGDLLRPKAVLAVALVVLTVVVALGVYLSLHPSVGPLALPLGMLGLVAGIGYSVAPMRWAYRGAGEMIIGLAYGWLTVNTGYYLLSGTFTLDGLMVAIPLGLSVFNIILINEFPDIEADRTVGKENLVVRYGPAAMARLYVIASAATAFALFLSVVVLDRGPALGLMILPGAILAAANAREAAGGAYREPGALEALCGRSIILNLVIAVGYGLGYSFL